MDLDAIAARFRRAGQPDAEQPPAQHDAAAHVERPWLTAEAHYAELGIPELSVAGPPPDVAPSPARRAAGRGPKRRRWTMPPSPAERRQAAIDPTQTTYRCPYCGDHHQGIPMGSGGLGDYGRVIVPEPGQQRPKPLGHTPAHVAALQRDWRNSWRASPAAEPRPPGPLTLRERVARLGTATKPNPAHHGGNPTMAEYFRPDTGERGRDTRQRTVADRAHGRQLAMRADDPADLAKQIRFMLWQYGSRTRARGEQRDRLALALVRSRYPAARGAFPDAALRAVLREPAPGRCSWDAYLALAALDGEPTPTPTPALSGLLGRPCGACQGVFAADQVAMRERATLAAAAASPPPKPAASPATPRKPLPPFYGSRRVESRR